MRFPSLQIRTCVFRTCVFYPCEMRCFVLAFSVLAFSSTCVFSAPFGLCLWTSLRTAHQIPVIGSRCALAKSLTRAPACKISYGRTDGQRRDRSKYRTSIVSLVEINDKLLTTNLITPPPMGERSIVMSVSVCLCVTCLSVRDHIFGTTRPIFTKLFTCVTMAVARSSFGGVVIRYVSPVSWVTTYLHISHGCSTSPQS